MKMELHTSIQADGAQTALSLDGVFYGIEGRKILRGLSIEVEAARIGIVGRNGSGKSTLARALAGLIAPDSGTLKINGHDLAKDRKTALSEVGVLFQNPDHQIIFPTVDEEISFGLRQQGLSKDDADQRCRNTLSQFGKSHWAGMPVTALSQGQKHLLCLMAVAAMGPRMIILDEPFTGLDIPTRMQLRRYLNRYAGGIAHVSHQPEDLIGCEIVIWLEKGSVEATGAADKVLRAFSDHMHHLGELDDLSDLSV